MPADSSSTAASVSIVVVNYDGKDYLERCLGSLRELAYDHEQLEVILIDNASTDGSVAYVQERFPEVRIVRNDDNVGFSPAVNQGAKLASGEYLALLNNDAEADPLWIAEAVKVLRTDDTFGCAASKILRDDRRTIDYAGGHMAFFGHGYARALEQQDLRGHPSEPTLFPSGGAMVVPTALFLDVGGFDDGYFAFFEDVDFGWRLWVLGYEVRYVPTSRVYHRHHGTIERFGYARERYLLERNALATVFKNYGEDLLARTLPPTLLLTLMRAFVDQEEALPDYRITSGAAPMDDESIAITALAGAHLAAVRDFGFDLERLAIKRHLVQSRRRREDYEILPLFEKTFLSNVNGPEYVEVFRQAVKVFGLEDKLVRRNKVLIITQDTLSRRMAGPAIRCWEMAAILSQEHDVVLASTSPVDITHPDFETVWMREGLFQSLYHDADVIVFQGFVNLQYPQVIADAKPLLVDLYDPFHLEGITLRKYEPELERFLTAKTDVAVLNEQLIRGDFFVCASDKQRDFWLGQLSGLGRINPATFDQDESLRTLIDLAPFGMPSGPPVKTTAGNVVKGVVEGIDEDDFLLVWGGGIYNWFDPLTLIRGVARVVDAHPDVKLWFMGNAHPNPGVPKMQMAADAYQLADELGLLGKHVFFNDGWVPYHERQNYLMEADVGVSTHFEHLETAYSFRTRILDYLWCSLPIVATEGDNFGRLVADRGLGVAVPPEDVDAVADAIRRLRTDRAFYEACQRNIGDVRPAMYWERALEPILRFCRTPRRSADAKGKPYQYIHSQGIVLSKSPWHYAKRAVHYARTGGVKLAAAHVRNFVRLRAGR